MSNAVNVEGISSQTSEKEVHDFFSFCGKISNLKITPHAESGTQSATVTFEKDTAAKTALLLDSTQLGPSQVKVTSAGGSHHGATGASSTETSHEAGHDVEQEDKPRSRIVAEYLAHGYVISDKAIERAIALDKQHGISTRFTSALKTFDDRFKATEKAAAVDTRYGVSDKAFAGWRGMNSYFEKALDTPTGQRVRKFYEEGNKQVFDVHNEARHLANLKSGKSSTGATPTSADTAGVGSATSAASGFYQPVDPEKAELEKVGEGKTKCNCGGVEGVCACKPGECTCASCNRNPAVSGTSGSGASTGVPGGVPGVAGGATGGIPPS